MKATKFKPEYYHDEVDGYFCPCGNLEELPDDDVWFDVPTGNFTVGVNYSCPECNWTGMLSVSSSFLVELEEVGGVELTEYRYGDLPDDGDPQLCPCSDPDPEPQLIGVNDQEGTWFLYVEYTCQTCYRDLRISGMSEYILERV